MPHPTEPTHVRKPSKPPRGFPLREHKGSGQWCKKINKRVYYFGSIRRDPTGKAAQEQYERELPYLRKGQTPPPIDVSHGCTLRQLCNDFLRSKEAKLNAGDLSPRSFRDYYRTCELLIDHFGKERQVGGLAHHDFRDLRAKLAQRFGVTSLGNEINRIRILFNYAHESNLIDKPVSYGQCFDKPSAKALRKVKNEAGPNFFERDEVQHLLTAADPDLRAMIYLGLNAGLGNSDVGQLRESHLDLEHGWLNYPRVKTEIPRRVPLWAETVAALKASMAQRSAPADSDAKGFVFLTRQGRPWVRINHKQPQPDEQPSKEPRNVYVPIDAVGQQFGKLLRKLKINGRQRLGFYTLRRCFETYAGESKDQVAVDSCMGHVDTSMAGVYRQRISDDRLRAVVNVVHDWLFGSATEQKQEGGAK